MKNYYLVAPGESVTTTSKKNYYQISSGTSFSAPMVTGAMALLKEKYPFLTGKSLTKILFATATDLGAPGVDNVYGHGLLNIQKAFQPIGTLSIPNGKTVNSSQTNLNNTRLSLSAAFGDVLLKTKMFDKVVAIDKYKRPFQLPMTKAITLNNSSNFSFDHFYKFLNDKHLSLGINQNNDLMFEIKDNNNDHFLFSYSNDLLGTTGNGGFDLGKALIMFFKLNYGYGKTSITKKSLISNISDLHALGGNIAIEYNGYGFQYSIPLHIINGKANLKIPESRDLAGNINYQNYNQDLKVKSFEQKFTFFFKEKIKDYNLFASYDIVKNENNIKSSNLKNNFYLKFNRTF